MDSTVSILHELPEVLHQTLVEFLEANPNETQDSVMTKALAQYLAQQQHDRLCRAAKTYLDEVYKAK